MAGQESDREDLLREATTLVERVELASIDCQGANITAGFRPDGAASIFFGAEPVYQFNAAGELRRAYCDGLLFRAARGRLISLRRVRRPDRVELLRHDLTDDEQSDFLVRMRTVLRDLSSALDADRYKVVGQIPANVDVASRLKAWLAQNDGMKIALTAHATRPGRP